MTVDFLGILYSYKNSQLAVWRKLEEDKGYLHPFLVLKGKPFFLKKNSEEKETMLKKTWNVLIKFYWT